MGPLLRTAAVAVGTALVAAGCSSAAGTTLGVTEAAEKFAAVAGLCDDPTVTYVEGGERVQFTDGGPEYIRPGYSSISCPLDSATAMTTIAVFDTLEDKVLNQHMACLTIAQNNPDQIDQDLTYSDLDTEWVNGANWDGWAMDSSAQELATALGGTTGPRRGNCEPFVDEMLTVAAAPLAVEPKPELARAALIASGLFFGVEDDTMDQVLDMFCQFLEFNTEAEILEQFASNKDGALLSVKQTEAVFEALRMGGYTCPPTE